jgi:hypothetical protein
MGILTYEHLVIIKLRSLFEEHLKNMDDFIYIWRPYPAINEALAMLRPELVDDFNDLVSFYRDNSVGIFDDILSPTPAIIISDEYLGDACGIMELFRTTGKTIEQLNYD